ncbi:hypothetical protein RSPO_m00160 (plasmid) [Ralstonia solanacearum Po82]|uniref:Uncharacterized protein n=1 Tax=Ralstonia solanacearum (strain Po82) TaxID=1031711 RepID=F6G849_RALS8|nr:hypothetical protein RSPO_m00160 [Ralstonia solanacearum Po82]
MGKSIGIEIPGKSLSNRIEITNRPDLPNASWKLNHPIASKNSWPSTPSQYRVFEES